MANPVQVTMGRDSARVHVAGLRVHHGLTGCALLGLGLASGSRRTFLLGVVLVAHDWRDRPWSFIDP